MISAFLLLADAAPAATGEQPPAAVGALVQYFPLIIIAALVFFVFNSQRKQKKERLTMLSGLRKGDGVTMNGGEIGKIVDLDDRTVLVKVDETNNTKIRYRRDAVLSINDRKDGSGDTSKDTSKDVGKDSSGKSDETN